MAGRPGVPPGFTLGAALRVSEITFCNLRGQPLDGFFSTLFVVIFGFDTTFNRIAYSTRGHDCHKRHPLLLILA